MLKEELIEAVIECGKKTWEEGLLLKSESLCHGTAGNGYIMHSLYRCCKLLATRCENVKYRVFLNRLSECWRAKAYGFALALCDESLHRRCSQYTDPSIKRQVVGIPDHP